MAADVNGGRTGQPDIVIRYGAERNEDSSARILVRIHSNQNGEAVRGHLTAGGRRIPLFEVPQQTGASEQVVAVFRGEETEYACITVDGNCLDIGFDVFRQIGRVLADDLDTAFDTETVAGSKLTRTPVVDALEDLLFDTLEVMCKQASVSLETRPFWPDGKKFAVCLTHDVDRVYKTYQYLPSILKDMRRVNISGVFRQVASFLLRRGKLNPYWNFDKIMGLESELGVRSTFFFLNERRRPSLTSPRSWVLFAGRYRIDDPNVLDAIRRLHGGGFEVGVHGSYNSYMDVGLLKTEKQELERILGDKVYGLRQHYLNMAAMTPRLQESAGFQYDTTVGFNEGIGFRRGTCYPYHPFDLGANEEMSLLEIPLTVMDGAIPRDRDTMEQCTAMIDAVERHRGVVVLLWHQRMFCEADFPGMAETYRRLILEALRRNAWVATASEVCDWVINRRRLDPA